jgi:hypothetical protein
MATPWKTMSVDKRSDDPIVMAGLVPAIHAVGPRADLASRAQRRRVDGRDEPGHDGEMGRARAQRVGTGFSPR